jgi:hypothetical protein
MLYFRNILAILSSFLFLMLSIGDEFLLDGAYGLKALMSNDVLSLPGPSAAIFTIVRIGRLVTQTSPLRVVILALMQHCF